MASTHPAHAEIIALARKTPLSAGAVADLAKKVPAELAAEVATIALDTAGAPAALVLAFVAAGAGAKVPAETAWQLVTEVLSLDQVGPLLHSSADGPLAACTSLLGAEGGDLELECLVLLLAADLVADGAIPPGVLRRARWLARHKLEGDSSIWLGGAALRLKDSGLTSLAGPHVNRAKRNKKVIDDALATSRLAPLEVLPELDGARLSSGFTVKHDGPAVGRNDPCPCGSGKKYKKCCDGKTTTTAEPKLDPAALGPDQIALMRAPEIAALETTRLSAKAFTEAFHRMLDFKRVDLAERMLAEARDRKELKDDLPRFVTHTLHTAFDREDRAAAERIFALLPENAQKEQELLALEFLRKPEDLFARIEAEAHAGLREEKDGGRGMVLAATLLRFAPALGIYVARGALHEARSRDSRALLREIEDARDRLLLSPFEMWWDVYDSFFDIAEEAKEQKKDDAKREKMKADLRLARAASRKTSNELEKLQKRVAELDELVPSARPTAKEAAKPVSADPELSDERRRLKGKIDELQRIIGEGQDERRELRRQLAEREEDEPAAPAAPAKKEPEPDDDSFLEAGDVDGPRQVLLPRYSDRASKILLDLSADAADGVLTVVAGLAAGKPNAWSYVKKLSKVKGYFSARAGIHHRILFAVEDRVLDVVEVLHRKDLEQVVTRLARIG